MHILISECKLNESAAVRCQLTPTAPLCAKFVEIGADKGQAHALPLHTTILSWPNNFAAVAPAQVVLENP